MLLMTQQLSRLASERLAGDRLARGVPPDVLLVCRREASVWRWRSEPSCLLGGRPEWHVFEGILLKVVGLLPVCGCSVYQDEDWKPGLWL
jgi:hypothetical protein